MKIECFINFPHYTKGLLQLLVYISKSKYNYILFNNKLIHLLPSVLLFQQLN